MARLRRWLPALLACVGVTAQAQAPGAPPPPLLPAARQADAIHVYKAQRRMDLLRGDRVIATYRIVLGGAPVGHKREQGDGRTPEGDYRITYRNARSRFHLSLRISYPDDADRRQALARGVDPGGDIMVHGATPSGSRIDWTEGCIAVSNDQMEAIWQRVPVGTPIRIAP